jgi:hypothetical protein
MKKNNKFYTGNIPFDIWGNQETYESCYKIKLTEENFKTGELLIQSGGGWRKPYWDDVVLGLFRTKDPIDWYGQPQIATINSQVMIPNYTFFDTLIFDGYSRGRSAANMILKSKKLNRKYSVFMSDIGDIIMRMNKGEISDNFTFSKKGANYGMKLA